MPHVQASWQNKPLPFQGICGTITAIEWGDDGRAHDEQQLHAVRVCWMHNRVAELVQRVSSLYVRVRVVKTPHEQTAIQRQIEATDHEIDRLVYELYDRTDEEIRVVEEATAR